jgi:hypothetical protein
VRQIRWEPLSKAQCSAGALLQYTVQAVSHNLRTQQKRKVKHHLNVCQNGDAHPQHGSESFNL